MMQFILQAIKTGRRKLLGQSHLQEETPGVLKRPPSSPHPELTSVLSLLRLSPHKGSWTPVLITGLFICNSSEPLSSVIRVRLPGASWM